VTPCWAETAPANPAVSMVAAIHFIRMFLRMPRLYHRAAPPVLP
jgi:hypothetical protein